MKTKTHFLLGAGISWISGAQITHEAAMASLLGILGGVSAVIPDMDLIFAAADEKAHRSQFSHSLGSSLVIAAAMMIPCVLIVRYTGFVLSNWWIAPIFASLFLSTFSHPATDSLTRAGTRLLWPISNRRFRGDFKYNDIVANSALSVLGLILIVAAVTCTEFL
ncbi:MAG TPA: metal-dependent hydrolase [Euryarchaeota archaeon]|nr:metal-dependent hydrolase [Euryarchaeota archaeon]